MRELPVLAFERVALVTGGARLFDGLDLSIAPGERPGVVGDSGAGESMIARLAVGLTPPLSGEVRLFGLALDRLDAVECGVCAVAAASRCRAGRYSAA